MGYYMTQICDDFLIEKGNVNKAWESLKELFAKDGVSLSWIIAQNVLNARSFDRAMSECRWDITYNDKGDCDSITFNGEKYAGDEEVVLGAIAPFVEEGAYIQMQDEDGERWIWTFSNGAVEEQNDIG